MLRQIVEHDVLNQTAICEVRQATHEQAQNTDYDVRDEGLLEHASWLVLL